MYQTDYHLHTDFSFDGHQNMDELCEKAIAIGLNEIAITDHMDSYSDKPYESILDCPALMNSLERCREKYKNQIIIRKGIELGQPMVNKVQYRRFLLDYPDLDFIIGSVHNMEGDIDVSEYDFNKKNPYQVFDQYLDWLIDFAANYDCDVIGHITYPLRYFSDASVEFDLKDFYEKLEFLFKCVIENGKGIELNVSGFRQRIMDSMPPKKILALYKECKGEILTFGSDAHFNNHVGHGLEKGRLLAKETGFKYATTFEHRKPKFYPL